MSDNHTLPLGQFISPEILWELRPTEFPGRIDDPLPAGKGTYIRLLVSFQYPDGRPLSRVYCRNQGKLKKGTLVLFELVPTKEDDSSTQKTLLMQAVSVRQASREEIDAVTKQFRHAKLERLAKVLQQKVEDLEAERRAVKSHVEQQVREQRENLNKQADALKKDRREMEAMVEQQLAAGRAELQEREQELHSRTADLDQRQARIEEDIEREVGRRVEKQLLAVEEQRRALESLERKAKVHEQRLATWQQQLEGQREELAQARIRFQEEGGDRFLKFLASLNPSQDNGSTVKPLEGLPVPQDLLSRLNMGMWACGYTIQKSTLLQCLLSICVAASTGQFVILTGPTGVGKTSMASLMASALGAGSGVVPVRPGWIDPSDLLGFFNPQQNSFQPTPFMDKLLEAQRWAAANRLFLLTLDEMNLSRVENYAADFLSRLEKARAGEPDAHLSLYALELEKRLRAEIKELYAENSGGEVEQQRLATLARHLECYPAQMDIPAGLVLLGTINLDETTHLFSPKFLDRSFIVQIGHASLPERLSEARTCESFMEPVWELSIGAVNALFKEPLKPTKQLEKIWYDLHRWLGSYLAPLGVQLGFRLPQMFRLFMTAAKGLGLGDTHAVASAFFESKLLPWISFHRDDFAVGLEIRKSEVLINWSRDPDLDSYPSLKDSIERMVARGGLVIRYLE